MKIIDAHCHGTIEDEKEAIKFTKKHGIEYSEKAFLKELSENNIVGAVSIGAVLKDKTPTELNALRSLAKRDKRVFPVCGVNPLKASKKDFETFRKALKNREVYGMKILLGYYPFFAMDKRYTRFYKLAEECDCPVIFHTGDTFGSDYPVKYAHPLQIDEVSLKFRNTKFVIAHLGNPWTRDAAEVVYKNPNVFCDLSALFTGFAKYSTKSLTVQDIKWALDYAADYSKFMYGSDWPLIKMKTNISSWKKIIPKKHHTAFFYKNAKKLFKLRL